ncbi:hypothetical protein [Streptomyces sp. SPB162]|uniref:hypothetical protein n=1 Tax=Streptomyces sp. SPB162 TaxID=2940560 RepID=UPI00240587CA|nr:hypothetical protein [Streptomyces sp. SPB162]MDF9810864.1 hypothetical protein [Streptomyces sp. SPB162]
MATDLSSPQNERFAIGPGEEDRVTLLRAVATMRSLDEVAALVTLLNESGGFPPLGDEALRLAAVSRPLPEVCELVGLLNKPPHKAGDAEKALRAAAMGRPIEEVAELLTIFSTDRGEAEPLQAVACLDERPTDLRGALNAAVAPRRPTAGALAALNTARFAKGRGASGAEATTAFARGPAAASSTRSVLRWPAAAALLVIGAIHLPSDIAGLRTGDVAAGISLGIALLCLILAGLLAMRDTVWIWAASAAAAVVTVAVHSFAPAFSSVSVLRDSWGGTFTGATGLAVACAIAAALLAATALLLRQRPRTVVRNS